MTTQHSVDQDQLQAREELHALVAQLMADLADDVSEEKAAAYLDEAMRTRPALIAAAKRAGGAWKLHGGQLVFESVPHTPTLH